MSTRLNKDALAAKLVEAGTFSTKVAATEAINSIVDTIKNSVIAGDSVALPGFGKFEPFTRQNGIVKPKFAPFDAFKDAVAG